MESLTAWTRPFNCRKISIALDSWNPNINILLSSTHSIRYRRPPRLCIPNEIDIYECDDERHRPINQDVVVYLSSLLFSPITRIHDQNVFRWTLTLSSLKGPFCEIFLWFMCDFGAERVCIIISETFWIMTKRTSLQYQKQLTINNIPMNRFIYFRIVKYRSTVKRVIFIHNILCTWAVEYVKYYMFIYCSIRIYYKLKCII